MHGSPIAEPCAALSPRAVWFAQLLFFGIVENVIRSHFDGANRVSLVCACGDDRATLDSLLNKRFVCNGLLI